MTEVIPIIQSLDLPANDRSGHFDNEGGDFMIGTKLEDGPAAANSFHLDDDNVCSSTQWNDDPHDDGDDGSFLFALFLLIFFIKIKK